MFEVSFRRTPVTLILIATIVALELASSVSEGRRDFYYTTLRLGMLSTMWRGAYWQPLTTSLLHGNLMHAGFNTLALFTLGPPLEQRLGSFKFLALTVLLAYVSMLPPFLIYNWSAPLNAQEGVVGFSGVLYGYFGLLLIGRRVHEELAVVCTDQTVYTMIGWFFFCIIVTRLGMMPVANVGHAAGWFFGMLYGWAMFGTKYKRLAQVLAVVLTLPVLFTLFAAPGHPLYEAMKWAR